MKLQLLHGPGIISSRYKLQSIKEGFDPNNIVVFRSESSAEQIIGSLQTPSLFSQDRLIVLENPPDEVVNCNLYPVTCTLVLWFDHLVDTKKWPCLPAGKAGFEYFLFSEDKVITVFPFLDCLANKDKKAFSEVQKLKLSGFDIFYILTMVFYLLRSLAVTPKNAPDFVKKKLVRQRVNFAPEKIIDLYGKVLEIEFKLKSGLLDQAQSEFLLINLFTD